MQLKILRRVVSHNNALVVCPRRNKPVAQVRIHSRLQINQRARRVRSQVDGIKQGVLRDNVKRLNPTRRLSDFSEVNLNPIRRGIRVVHHNGDSVVRIRVVVVADAVNFIAGVFDDDSIDGGNLPAESIPQSRALMVRRASALLHSDLRQCDLRGIAACRNAAVRYDGDDPVGERPRVVGGRGGVDIGERQRTRRVGNDWNEGGAGFAFYVGASVRSGFA